MGNSNQFTNITLRDVDRIISESYAIAIQTTDRKTLLDCKERIYTLRKLLEEHVKTIIERSKDVDEKILEMLVETGESSVKRANYTFYIETKERASAVDSLSLAQAFRESGFEELTTVNANTLSAWVKELPKNENTGEPVFPNKEIEGLVKVYTQTNLKLRKV